MKEVLSEHIREAIIKLKDKKGLEISIPASVQLERPRRKEHGDFSTNIAIVMARHFNTSPRDLAGEIKGLLDPLEDIIERVEIAGPGFINIFLKQACWYSYLREVVERGSSYGMSKMGSGKKVQIEFVSANPTGPLHVGHGRGAVVGDVLASCLKAAGFDVIKEYYINDVGNQMRLLGKSTYLRYMEHFGVDIHFPEEGYKGRYIIDIAEKIAEEEGDRFTKVPEEEAIPFFTEYASGEILKGIKRDLEDFGVFFDTWYSEMGLFKEGLVSKTIDELKDRGLAYESEGALWFKSTEFGDDKDRVLMRSNGETTYFASDIAYHKDKIRRGFDRIIDVWGADHHGYQPRIRAFMKSMGAEERLDIVLVQLVTLIRGGEKVSMSTRAGEFVTLRDVIDEVGRDAARFFFLLRKSDAHLEFDLDLAKEQTPENPVFYVQYAHARICSIFSLAKERGIKIPDFEDIEPELLSLDEEIELIKTMLTYPDVIGSCVENLTPHYIPHFLIELVGMFHSYYNRHRVVSQNKEDLPLTLARLYLCRCIKVVIENALKVLGVSAPEKM